MAPGLAKEHSGIQESVGRELSLTDRADSGVLLVRRVAVGAAEHVDQGLFGAASAASRAASRFAGDAGVSAATGSRAAATGPRATGLQAASRFPRPGACRPANVLRVF